ncbi:MAG: nucleotidyltransferase family protein [Nitrospinota bacterium]
MRLEHVSPVKLKKLILEIAGRHLDLTEYRLFFFGSRVSGTGNERSDIDIGIEGPEPLPAKLFADIVDEVEELPVLYKIEIVDFKKVSPDFREVALQYIEDINSDTHV